MVKCCECGALFDVKPWNYGNMPKCTRCGESHNKEGEWKNCGCRGQKCPGCQAREATIAREEEARRAREEQARRATEEQARRAREKEARRAKEEQARRAREEEARRAKEEGKAIEELERQMAAMKEEMRKMQEEKDKEMQEKDKEIERLKKENEELRAQLKTEQYKQKKQNFKKKMQEPGWEIDNASQEDIAYLFEEFEIEELLKPLNDVRVSSIERMKALNVGLAVTLLKIDHFKASKLVFAIELMTNGIYSKEDKEKHLQSCSICKMNVKKGLQEYGVAANDIAAIAEKFAGMHFGEIKNLQITDCANMGIEASVLFDLETPLKTMKEIHSFASI